MRTTEQLYGISPDKLKAMTYEEALNNCLIGTKQRLAYLMETNFMYRDESLVSAVHKAQHWCIAKIQELGPYKTNRFKLFILHIKMAFKALFNK